MPRTSWIWTVSNSKETRQFRNDHKGITAAVSYIADLKPAKIILEATGKYEIPSAAELQPTCYIS